MMLVVSCNPLGQIEVKNIVNPDDQKPTVVFFTTAPAVMNGAQDFSLDFEVKDNAGGSGISRAQLMYSPDGDNLPFVAVGSFGEGRRVVNFCPPNKNHPKPAFKIVATDNNSNSTEETLGLVPAQNFSIALTEPVLPTVSSSEGLATSNTSTDILIDACKKTACSTGALYYEAPTNNLFIAVAGAQPLAGDGAWLTCESVLASGYDLPAFGSGDGNYTYNVWVKSEDTDLDSTPMTSISSSSQDITVSADITAPTASFVTAAGVMNSLDDFALSYNISDGTSGVASAKLFYTPDFADQVTYPYVEIGSVTAGSPGSVDICSPQKTHPNAAFKFVVTDAAGNSTTVERSGFSINKTSDPILPTIASISEASPITNGSANIRIAACLQRSCNNGALTYEAADNNVFIAVATSQPAVGASEWVSCSDVLTNGYTYTFPTQVGSGFYNSASLWVKSEGLDLDGSTPIQVVSTSSVPLSIPFDYTVPAITGTVFGDLEITGTNILTGYSQGSFRLLPTCADPTYLPSETALTGTLSFSGIAADTSVTVTGVGTLFSTELAINNVIEVNNKRYRVQSISSDTSMVLSKSLPIAVSEANSSAKKVSAIAGSVTVSSNNTTVTGVGTTFTTDFSNLDYTNINGVLTQIKTVVSDTQLILNENAGNTPALVGAGLIPLTRIKPYGGLYVSKGLGAPPAATDSGWQTCDSINQTVLYDNLVNGVNNLQFWIKDVGNNVNSAFIAYNVTYNAPILTVVNGPTISTEVADITINACGGGTKITHVLFNETGTQPTTSDPKWQTCSTVAGALKSDPLSPGNHNLKAFFKYTDNFISKNPVNVPVNYLPNVAWVESPVVNRPHTSYTLASCVGVDEVFVNQGAAPLAGDSGWQTCSTATGAITYTLTSSGSQSVNIWYKTGTTVSPDFSQVTVNFVPPTASIFGGSVVNTTQPPLSLDQCTNISKVYIKVDEAVPAAPTAGDFAGSGVNCTTALNGIIPPAIVGEGNHTYDVWYLFNDGYILDPWYSRVSITYKAPDVTPPPITGGEGADVPLVLTLENGDGAGAVPGPIETIESYGSRASFTLNTCTPKPNVALTGTVLVTAATTAVTGVGTSFTTELAAGDYILINGESRKIKSIETDTGLTLILPHTAGAAGVSASRTYPEDVITGMIWKNVAQGASAPATPAADDTFWQACSNANNGFKTESLADGNYDLYAFFKDSAGNVSSTSMMKSVTIASSPDVTDPPRPEVIVEGAPILTSAPAQLTVTSCVDVDQVYIETSQYPAAYVEPDPGLAGWQNCSTAIGSITYDVNLAGSYTVSVWFKDAAGNINNTPRDVSFIFDPTIGNLPMPVAYWTMDKTHTNKNRIIDAKGDNHLYKWRPNQVTETSGRHKEGLLFSGTDSYLFTENTSTLKPSISVTLSLWAYLTKNDAGTKGLAGNGSYGLRLNSGNLQFYASGISNVVSVSTNSYESGWRHVVGTSDGRYLKLYVDGKQVSTTNDLGSAANLSYGCEKLFVVGGMVDGCNNNPKSSELFDNKIDEVVVWNQYFTDQEVLDHYIDAYNNYKVKQDSTPPANIASATFAGEFMQNALLTIGSCGDAKFVYVNETTHPPTVDSTEWQLCNTEYAGIIHPNLSQGTHELKIWAKDEYDNISTGYLKIDTSITGIAYQYPGIVYYTLDNNHLNVSTLYDIFSGHTSTNVGASANQSAIQNEGFLFSRAESDYVEKKYAYNAQPEDKVTMSIWANLTANNNLQQVLAGTRSTNHGYNIEINSANSELRFNVETAAGLRYAAIPVSAYTTAFHNVIGVYDGRYVKLYLDGNQVDSRDYSTTSPIVYTCLGSFIIGAESSCNSGPVAGTHFDNKLDEVIVWNDALSAITIYDFFNGQDTVPPSAVAVTPKDNNFSVGIPVARFNVSDCSDVSAVYVSLDSTPPLADIANWQSCATTGDTIKSPLLADGSNLVKFWFKDAAGNVSLTSTDLTMNFTYDFTIPIPDSYWTFDDVNVDGAVAFDVTSGKDGTLNGTLQTNGQVNEARTFNGANEFVEVPYDSVFQPTGQVTLSAWFKATAFDAVDHVIAGNLNGGGYSLVLGNNTLEFRVVVDSVTEVISTPTGALNVADWHHAVGVYDNGTLRLFLNGAEILPSVTAASSSTNITYTNSNSLIIGAAATATTGAAGDYFAGAIDEVSFFDAALTDTVVTEMYNRGVDGDQIYYSVTPPSVPPTLNITYYNSLVARANLTVNSCTGLDYIIVTKDEFPPDKNDVNWQRCNTLVGGLLSHNLTTSDSFGKLWTKDNFGNISKTFEYVPITTKYNFTISRPVVHWTFDNTHYLSASRTAYDRLSQIDLKSETLKNIEPDPTGTCRFIQGLDPDNSTLQTNQAGVLNQSFLFGTFGTNSANPTILRANHPENSKLKPTEKLTVAAWVYIPGNTHTSNVDKHIVSNMVNGKGWALRYQAADVDDNGLRFTVYTSSGVLEPYLEPSNILTGWHLVVGTYDGQKASLYLDGIFVKSFSAPAPSPIVYESGVNTFVGAQASTGDLPTRYNTYEINTTCMAITPGPGANPDNSYWTNRIDEILVWDTSLDGLEISSLYHNGADVIYVADTTPPANPMAFLENTRPNMFTNKAYFSVNSCTDISGVLVNEGTQPDKQDARWEVCRDRLGSFGIENLDPGGHTVTLWFKDLAGNVTPVSTDVVVNYNDAAIPSANAVWPLDATHAVSKFTRDVVDNKIHDFLMSNIDTSVNPTATHTAGKVNEGLMLGAANSYVGAYLTAASTKLLRPVNYLTVGGWFYLTTGDTATKVLIDHHHFQTTTDRSGLDIRMAGGNLTFRIELDIADTRSVSTSMSSISTGWHHVAGIFTGYHVKLFIDGVEVASLGPLAERDYVRWDTPTSLRIGAESQYNANPSNFFGEKVDELAVYGFDMTLAQLTSVISAGNSSTHVYSALAAPANVDNAYIYHYDNFGPRARMTILDCTSTPYVIVVEENAAVPSNTDAEWRNCLTTKGAILSKELPLGTQFVDVYAKNSDGVISSVAGRKEIDPIVPEKKRMTGLVTIAPSSTSLTGAGTAFTTQLSVGDYLIIENEVVAVQSISNDTTLTLAQPHTLGATGVNFDKAFDYDLALPITYFSFNIDQLSTVYNPDFFVNAVAQEFGGITHTANADGSHLSLDGTADYLTTSTLAINDLRKEISVGIWAQITQSEAPTLKRIVSRNADFNDTSIVIEGDYVKFKVNVAQPNALTRSTPVVEAVYPTSKISTGMHFLVGIYDGRDAHLYIDAIKVDSTNVGYRNYATDVIRPIDQNQIDGFRFSHSVSPGFFAGALDEFILFDRVMTESEIVSWYKRYKWAIDPNDSTYPTTNPNISVLASTFGANWPTDNPNPMYSLDDCTDIAGVYITIDGAPAPSAFDSGWQRCETDGAYLLGPTLTGTHTVSFWFKDAHGNVTPTSKDITVVYSAPTRPDPVAYWSMDDEMVVGRTIYDSVNQLNAHMYGIVPSNFIVGRVNNAIDFDGVRKYLEVEHNLTIKPIDEISISFWVNIVGTYLERHGRYVLGTRGDTAEGYSFGWTCDATCTSTTNVDNEFFEFRLNLENGGDFLLDYPQKDIGTGWKHFVGTYDGRYMKLYLNGNLIRSKDLKYQRNIYYKPPSGSYLGTSLIMMAKASDTEKPSGGYYSGDLDEVAIYNTALYASHVTDIYNNFANAGTKIYVPALSADTPSNADSQIYEPGRKSFGSRIKLTMANCTDKNMILVNDSTTAPANNDENWQPCNTYQGGILSAPLPSGAVTPRVWAKTFTGDVSAASGTANGASYTLPSYLTDIPRPEVVWSLDSTFVGATVGTTVKDSMSVSHGEFDVVGVPTNTMSQAAGTVSISSGTNSVSGASTSFTTDFVVGDRIRIGNETLQIQSIANDFSLTTETNHISGAAASVYYRLGTYNSDPTVANISVIEGGFTFDGLDDRITTKPTAATNPFYKISISAWVELKKGETQHRHIVGNNQYFATEGGAGTGLRLQNGQLQFYVSTSPGVTYVAGIDTNIYPSGMHHVTGTYNGQDLHLYLDGVKVATYAITLFGASYLEIYHDDTSHWSIGSETGLNNIGRLNTFFDGVIDDVNIWHDDLTPQQVYYAYEYGAIYLPSAVPDGNAPDDPVPGIYLSNGLTNTNMPWVNFTMPSCTGNNGIEINAIYVKVGDTTPPNKADPSWQYCSTDAAYIISSLLNEGASNVYIFYRDEEGDVSSAPAATFSVTYNPPNLVNPMAYYTFDAADRFSSLSYKDKAGTRHIRAPSGVYTPIISGKVGDAFNKGDLSNNEWNSTSVSQTYTGDYHVDRDFSIAFWYKMDEAVTGASEILINQGQFSVIRNNSETLTIMGKNSTNRLQDGVWHHIGATRTGATLRIYFDGKLDSSHFVGAANFTQNILPLSFAHAEGVYDEILLYDQGLTPEQMAHIYYLGATNQTVDVFVPNFVEASRPDFYWNFDDALFADPYLNSVTGSLPMRKVSSVTSGQTGANSKVNESFYFERYEDTIRSGGEPPNSVGIHQYLESDSAAPVTLGNNFTISLWVNQPEQTGFLGSGGDAIHTDKTAILDMWSGDADNQSFKLTYRRGNAGTSGRYFDFEVRTNLGAGVATVSSALDQYSSNTWIHVALRRKDRVLTMFINGIESGAIDLTNVTPLNTPANTRLRMGESSLYSFYNVNGTVSVAPGTTAVVGIGTNFTNDLFIPRNGTVTVGAGSNAVVGVGTSFNTELAIGRYVKIAGEIFQVASIADATNMTLSGNHVGGAAGVSFSANNTIRIGLQNFTTYTIVDDTNITLGSAHTDGITNGFLAININKANSLSPDDEFGYKGYLDEVAIWNKALTQRQIYNLTVRGNAGQSIPVDPVVALDSVNASTSVDTPRANLKVNDCGGYTHVWVGFQLDAAPTLASVGDATYPGWVACDPNTTFESATLAAPPSTNNLRLWFHDGSSVAGYTTDISINRVVGDTTPPSPPMVTKVNSEPTTDAFARFTIGSCTDIAGVYVGTTGSTPAGTQSGWQACTTTAAAMVSPAMTNGVNNISVWFKDASQNVSVSTDFAITYNAPAVPPVDFYLTMDNAQITTPPNFQREVVTNDLGQGINNGSIGTGYTGMVNQAVNFNTNGYFDFNFSPLTLGTAMSVSAWVNINAPAVDSHIIGRWDQTSANDSFAIRVDANGRVCLDFQTAISTGTWNTGRYRRSCSSNKIEFAVWQNIMVTRNGSSVVFYINNVQAGTDIINNSAFKTSNLGIRVGAQDRGGFTSGVVGQIDELAVWDQLLTSDERAAVYAKGLQATSLATESAPVDPSADPDFYWEFVNGSDLLATFGGVDFTSNNGAVNTAGGQIDDFMLFTSTSSHVISTGATTNIDLDSDAGADFTISAWVNPTSLVAGDIISKWDTTTTDQEFRLRMTATGQVIFDYQLVAPASPAVGSIASVSNLVAGTWSRITVARNGTALYLYINDNLQNVATIGVEDLISFSTLKLSIGGNATNSSSYFNGAIDDVVMYKTYLPERKVKFNYDKGFSGNPLRP